MYKWAVKAALVLVQSLYMCLSLLSMWPLLQSATSFQSRNGLISSRVGLGGLKKKKTVWVRYAPKQHVHLKSSIHNRSVSYLPIDSFSPYLQETVSERCSACFSLMLKTRAKERPSKEHIHISAAPLDVGRETEIIFECLKMYVVCRREKKNEDWMYYVLLGNGDTEWVKA